MQNQYYNYQIKRTVSGLIYAILFLYTTITTGPLPFYIAIMILLLGSLYEAFKIIKTKKILIIFIIYIITAFYLLIKIKLLESGAIALFILLCHVFASDTGGYLVGKLFGKHMLSKISPQKTWEGVIGSLLLSLIVSLYFSTEITNIINIHHLFFSIIICTSCIIGDLIVSKIKRITNQKESGKFLPGHGGFLDRLDSLFMSTPVFFLSLKTNYLVICI